MSIIDRARELRVVIESLSAGMDDNEALKSVELFPSWELRDYVVGDRVRYNNVLYKCLQPHTSQNDWNPENAVSLWARVLVPDPEVIPEWVQPESTNPYMTGDKVTHNNKIWISEIDNNVWEPGVYGWIEVTS